MVGCLYRFEVGAGVDVGVSAGVKVGVGTGVGAGVVAGVCFLVTKLLWSHPCSCEPPLQTHWLTKLGLYGMVSLVCHLVPPI